MSLDALLKTAIETDKPSQEAKAFLGDLQGNILGNHGRQHTAHMFMTFADDKATTKNRKEFAKLTSLVTTAADQAKQKAAFKKFKTKPSAPHYNLFLTHAGYLALGIPAAKIPADAAFREGMAARGQKVLPHPTGPGQLNDPPQENWDEHLGGGEHPSDIHCMLLIADDLSQSRLKAMATAKDEDRSRVRRENNADGAARVAKRVAAVEKKLNAGILAVTGVDIGIAYKMRIEKNDEGLEHFGYMDGRSQPLFTVAQQSDEANNGINKWNPNFPPKNFIVKDPGSDKALGCGSYFVFRKLEQNVRSMKAAEANLAHKLGLDTNGLPAGTEERGGALLVGRFEDGTPLEMSCLPQNKKVPNNFTFAATSGSSTVDKCPFAAHVRKTNPRGDTQRLFNLPSDEEERSHIMARRGMTYGARVQNGKGEFLDSPSGGVGLMFMAFMSDIRNQFEFTQANWANEPRFASGFAGGPNPGIDPIIGQAAGAIPPADWEDRCQNPAKKISAALGHFVTLRGGHYYFAPSKSFLTSIK
jgi:Dyp-type peroxidase family